MRTSLSLFAGLVMVGALGCGGPDVPPPQDMANGQPTPPAGWSLSGKDLVSTISGNVGIATNKPAATLDVNGTLRVDLDRSLLPGQGCREWKLGAAQMAMDLGDVLAGLVDKYRCIKVTLANNTTWTWNKPVQMADFQRLTVVSESYKNYALDLTVKIRMTENRTFTLAGPTQRDPVRLSAGTSSHFKLEGVILEESANDPRPLTAEPGGALFVVRDGRQFATLELIQSRVTSTEDIMGGGDRVTASVLFGHTSIEKAAGAARDIQAVKTYAGWSFPGASINAMVAFTTLGPGVTFATTSDISLHR